MKNITALVLSAALVVAIGFGFSSCKDDDPPARPKLSFAETEITVNEDDGNLEVEIVLDKAFSKDLRIEYELGGTASDQDLVGTASADYEVVGDHGVVEIPAGETSGIIELEIYADAGFEEDETIEIAITDTNTDEIELTAEDETVITLTNDDDQLVASFTSATMTVNERDGVEVNGSGSLVAVPVSIPVQLDKPAPADIVLNYSIKIDLEDVQRNDAIDSTWGSENRIPAVYYDYYVIGKTGEVVVPSGATSANIELQLIVDFQFDPDETIEMTLEASDNVQLGTNKTMVVTVEETDGKVIVLVWDETYTDVDMDMFLWAGEDSTNLNFIPGISITPSVTERAEAVFIPSVFTDGAFGLSYVYYQGTANPMNFQARFIDYVDGAGEAPEGWEIFDGSYTLANINPWDNAEDGVYPPVIAQRFVVTDGVYSYGGLQEPSSASRTRPRDLEPPLRTRKGSPNVGGIGSLFGKNRSH